MKYFTVLSLLAVVLFTLGSGNCVADDEEKEAIADAHNRVVRAIFINPSGILAAQTRASTKSRSTRSSGSKRSPTPYGTPTVSYSTSPTYSYPTTRNPATGRVVTTAAPRPATSGPAVEEMNSTVTSYNSPGCRQATDQSLDQCVNVKGFNYTNLLQAFSSNNTDVYMPLLNRWVNILCGSNACRDALINVSRSCHSDELSRKRYEEYYKNTIKALCKVNEFGSSCVKTNLVLSNISGSFIPACLMKPTPGCRSFNSSCRPILKDFSDSEGCCALELYQIVYVEAPKLFGGNSTNEAPLNPWTACGLPSPGICTTTTKPPTIVTSPTPKVPTKTIFLPRGKVWPYTDPSRFITVGKLKKPVSRRIAVLATNRTKGQSWAIAFDTDLQSRTQFLIVSYPVPKYIVKVVSTEGSSYRLALERIPKKRYVSGAPFNNPGSSYIFTSKSCYRNSRFSGQYLQHVATGSVLTHNSGRRIFLSSLQSNGYGQCWVYVALQEWLP